MNDPRRWTIRTRLTALYGTMVLAAGIAIATVMYLVVRCDLRARVSRIRPLPDSQRPTLDLIGVQPGRSPYERFKAYVEHANVVALQELLVWSALSLAGLAIVSLAIGWWLAGKVLRPLGRITAAARRLSSDNLDQRIRLDGPRDELTDLAATFDRMLDRLEAAFDSQRRFVANASHELRTPLAIQRAAIQVGLDSPPSSERLAEVRDQLLEANRRSERLLDGLLLLARSDRGLEHCEPVALHDIVAEVLRRHDAEILERGIEVQLHVPPAVVSGDPVLLNQLVENLVSNAIRHNIDRGSILVRVDEDGLLVANTGPEIQQAEVARLFEPFHRGTRDAARAEGAGLGLSIVDSITRAHNGHLDARPGLGGGGLALRVQIPALPGSKSHDPARFGVGR